MQNESPTSSGLKVIAKVQVFYFKSRPNVKVKVTRKKIWYHVKGLATRNTHFQYKSPTSSGLKVVTKVKVFSKINKLKGQGKKNMVPHGRSCHKEYTC